MSFHLKKVNRITKAANRALSAFTKMERKLLKHNEKLASLVSDIDQTTAALSEARSAAVAQHTSNTVVVGNIAKIRGN